MGYRKMTPLQQTLYVIAESIRRRWEWILGQQQNHRNNPDK